jgi:hypothetical protein
MSAVKAKFPLPTMNGADLSTAVIDGLWRVTSAWRSIGAATALAARSVTRRSATTQEGVHRGGVCDNAGAVREVERA